MSRGGTVLSGREALDVEHRFYVPVAYSSNIAIVDGKLQARLSVPSEISLAATIEAWRHHPDSKLVLAGETDYIGLPNTTDLMEQRALETPEITKDAIAALHTLPNGRPLNHTPRQIAALSRYFRTAEAELQEVLVIPLSFHLKRVMQIARAYKLDATFVAAEDILQADGISQYNDYLPLLAELERSERIKRIVSRIDRQNLLFDVRMRTAGPNLLDIVEDETRGGYRLEQGFSRTEQKELQNNLAATKTQPTYSAGEVGID